MNRIVIVLSSLLVAATGSRAVADPMIMKAGEWELVVQQSGVGQMVQSKGPQKLCFVKDKAPADINANRKLLKDCGPPTIGGDDQAVTVDSTCVSPLGGNVVVHAVFTRAGDDAFHNETHMRFEGMPVEMTLISDAKRLGPCQPGDQQVK